MDRLITIEAELDELDEWEDFWWDDAGEAERLANARGDLERERYELLRKFPAIRYWPFAGEAAHSYPNRSKSGLAHSSRTASSESRAGPSPK